MADGAVRFITNSIDAGDPNSTAYMVRIPALSLRADLVPMDYGGHL